MTKPTIDQIIEHASPRPWSYHHDGRCDWIEDAHGTTILQNIGHLDGPLLVACVNEASACGTDAEALAEDEIRRRETA